MVGFSNDPQRVEEILVMKTLEVKGKKIFPVPLHASLLCNNEKVVYFHQFFNIEILLLYLPFFVDSWAKVSRRMYLWRQILP